MVLSADPILTTQNLCPTLIFRLLMVDYYKILRSPRLLSLFYYPNTVGFIYIEKHFFAYKKIHCMQLLSIYMELQLLQ